MATKAEFKCPLSQFVLADALGLTAIHVNRILRQLRELGLLTNAQGQRQDPRSERAEEARRVPGRLLDLNSRD